MNSSPINQRPVPPESDKSSSAADRKKFEEELKKVTKIKKTDPDEPSKKRHSAQLGDEDDLEELSASTAPASPLDASFHRPSSSQSILAPSPSVERRAPPAPSTTSLPPPSPISRDASGREDPLSTSSSSRSIQTTATPVPSPAYSPAPRVESPTPVIAPTPAPNPLPNSSGFYDSVDTSTNSSSNSSQNFSDYSYRSDNRSSSSDTSESRETDNDEERDDENQPLAGPTITKNKVENPSQRGEEMETPGRFPAKQTSKKKVSEKESLIDPLTGKPVSPEQLTAKKGEKAAPKGPDSSPEPKMAPGKPTAETGDRDLSQLPLSMPTSEKKPAATAAATGEQEAPGLPAAPSPLQPLSSQKSSDEKGPAISPAEETLSPVSPAEGQSSDKGDEQGSEHQKPSSLLAPAALPQFSPDIQPSVAAATTQAASYLNPQTMALFQQMVGTIYVMTSPSGQSTTEVMLNSPAFANSKFFGSTITIDKYATAPDSLNIRLSGPTDAVNLFNQNVSSLVAAFQNGNFAFKVRIETAYSPLDKPVFRRKGKGDQSGGSKDQGTR